MESDMNRTLSDSNINMSTRHNVTPPNYIAFRKTKRLRGEQPEEDSLEKFKEEMMNALEKLMKKQEEEFKKISPVLIDIQKTNENIENSISFLAAQNEEFKKKIEQLECENKKDKEYIVLLENKLEDVKRENQKRHFEIKNVPLLEQKETKDDLIKMVLCLSEKIDCPIAESEISDIYRVGGKRGTTKTTPIIVELSSAILKSTVLQRCKSFNIKNKDKLRAKHLGFTTREDTPIYLSEQLTAKGARLFFLARDLAKTKGYKFCWTSFGRVYVRRTTESPVVLISSEAQVHNLMQQI